MKADQVNAWFGNTALRSFNKHLIGYTYSDLPEYAYEAFLQRHEWHIQRFDVYVLHPWIEALVSKPGSKPTMTGSESTTRIT